MMKAVTILVLGVAVAIGLTGSADASVNFKVGCIGTESGGWGGPLQWRYAYEVTVMQVPGNLPMDTFQVGTDDMVWANYSRVMITDGFGNPIPGWDSAYPGGLANPSDPPESHWQEKTPHNVVSQGPQGICSGYVRWMALAGVPGIPVGQSVFCGFDNPNDSHDVGWTAMVSGLTFFDEDWTAAVGAGDGPVHGPVPEPATLALLGLGVAGLLARRRRK